MNERQVRRVIGVKNRSVPGVFALAGWTSPGLAEDPNGRGMFGADPSGRTYGSTDMTGFIPY